jgi:hypothetical protein
MPGTTGRHGSDWVDGFAGIRTVGAHTFPDAIRTAAKVNPVPNAKTA